MDLPTLLRYTMACGASDLHLSAGAPPMVRLDGETRRLAIDGIDLSQPSAVRQLIYGFLTDAQKKRLDSDWELDCALELGSDARFRANVFWQKRGLAGVFRVVPTKVPTAKDLGLPPVLTDLAKLHRGLVLVTGPTGSGKSTTLAAIIDHVNRTRRGHIITIEDPIEFVHTPIKCMINQREVNSHT
ncbi:MAG: type IV pilus twitching motility protein PilT, partial [Planctomycetota bacterium]